ncbi:MAG: serine acetyltransferase [Kaiparowitsia implicata GSE-PSE-MK54-09C]|jgi:putative colanic acid biosynthesis acetyltransferase WcaB|nr:serine acetyltransferase [Kaiparowitsia implicata GSE-PSE-MK54-09C]
MQYCFQDWDKNKKTSLKSRLVLVLFRTAQYLQALPKVCRPISISSRFIYQILVEWILGIEIPYDTQIGEGLTIQHGQGIVVNHRTIIGKNCILRNSTTIGNKQLSDGSYSKSPVIGDGVDIGANVVIIGPILIGENAIIGAGSIVVKDVPENAVVAGNPARILRIKINESYTNTYTDKAFQPLSKKL